ncbi:MAG: hypothetical protein NVS9B9_31080 [Ktedonobacteraceae bacterium]
MVAEHYREDNSCRCDEGEYDDEGEWIQYKYNVVRFFRDGRRKNKTIKKGLTLKQAQDWCHRTDTHGDGWFDGYTKASY